MISIKITSMMMLLLSALTLNSFSMESVLLDSYRTELKKMTLKNHRPGNSYTQARKIIMQQIHLERDGKGFFVEDVYCNKKIRNSIGPNQMPSHNIINIEHTWPQSRFSKRHNKLIQKADLHHLYPTDSVSNSKRGNHNFTELEESGFPVSESCECALTGRIQDRESVGFEPPEEHKGNVARALFYFSIRYDINIPDYEEFVLRTWNLIDPPDADELRRNEIIESIQGNRNPFIDDPEYADLITNF